MEANFFKLAVLIVRSDSRHWDAEEVNVHSHLSLSNFDCSTAVPTLRSVLSLITQLQNIPRSVIATF
jgi:hypothetical protein